MARNATFRILITYETHEGFAVLIRPQEMFEPRAAQLKLESDIERGLGESGQPIHPLLGELAARGQSVPNVTGWLRQNSKTLFQ